MTVRFSPRTSFPRRRLLRFLPTGGLRVRLVVAFGLVAVVAALSTGALTFRQARSGILQQSQDSVIRLLRDRVDSLAPSLVLPPSRQDLTAFAGKIAQGDPSRKWRVLVVYRGQSATSVPQDPFHELTAALRTAATTQTPTVFQRVTTGGRPSLVVGMPVMSTAMANERRASGLTVFLVVPQTGELGSVQALVAAMGRATVPAMGLAVLVALLAARGVLRPVRELRRATRHIAEGRLDTRLAVHGSDELADLSHTFNETAAALEESIAELRRMETKARRFAADVSHELRTPLAAMSVVTDILDEDATQLAPDTASAVRLISDETANLARLVEDLMEITRFDASAAALHLDKIDLAESVQRTLSSRGWQDSVVTVMPPPGVLRGQVDPRRLDVIVANLIGNALRHGAPPVRLSVSGCQRPTADGVRQWAVIEVLDNGSGIPDTVLPHIFDRFYKSDTARTRTEGSGLGLAITAENVRLHGGTIRAANHPDGGVVFTVELPLPESAEEDRP
ncbi:HAMP domain-containing histidine kinase [Streptomyces sp. NBC_01261]|nr:HAMP domain-containing sensor histidine kinase [Streptomyces sp. NBC_01261]